MKRNELTRADRELCGQMWTSARGQRLMETLGYDIGPRPTGSKAMRQAQAFLGEELRKLGAGNVRTQAVPVFAWRDAPSLVQLTTPRRRVYDSIQHVHSAAGTVTAPLLTGVAATGEFLDRLGEQVKGAIVLIRGAGISGGKFIPQAQRVRDIVERGAAAVLVPNTFGAIGDPAADMASVVGDAPIPVAGVSYETARELEGLAKRDRGRIRIEAAGKSYRTKCLNLMGELGPTRAGEEIVVLSAHVDTHFGSPGAFDNLTGVVTLMEIARVLAPFRRKFTRTLRLILFTAEEHYFTGSKAYVRDNADQLDRIQLVLNMDSLFPATAKGVAVMGAPAMRNYIERAFQATQCDVEVRNLFCMSSDYFPFIMEGIAAARPAHFDTTQVYPPWSHTRQDTPDKIPADWIRQNVMTFSQLLLRILTDPHPLPVKRKAPEQVEALVAKEGVAESLRVLGFDAGVPE